MKYPRQERYCMKKTFDAAAFMRKRREELSRAYSGLSAEQIKERILNDLKGDPLWKKGTKNQKTMSVKKEIGDCP